MKKLIPDAKQPLNVLGNEKFNISETMWIDLVYKVSSLDTQLEADELSLDEYKQAIAQSFTTVALTSNTANIDEADITNLVSSVIQNSDFRGSHIKANDIDVITAMIQNSLKAGNIETGSIKANTGAQVETLVVNDNARVNGNLEVGGTIDVDHVTVHSYNADTLTVSQAEVATENVTNSHIDNADVDNLTVDNAKITDVEITRAVIADIDNNHLDTEFITHKTNYLAQVDADNFYIKLPYFQNGAYYIYITDAANDDFVGCIEDFNSSNNHFFRWSFKDANVFNNIYLNGYNTHQSQSAYYLSTNGRRFNIYYQCTSFNTVEPPATSDVLGFTPDKRFNVTEINGNWFTMPVALYNEGEGGGVLTLTASDVLMYADDIKSYNGTSNVHNTVYKPNQSLNKTDDVTFNSVEAPFLDVAELSIVNKAKFPNVYNGPALSAAEQEDLMDDTLYIPQSGNATGTTVPGVEFVDRTSDESLNYWASSVEKAINQETFRTDEYKPTDGYVLSEDVTVSDVWRPQMSDDPATKHSYWHLIQNITTGEYFVMSQNIKPSQWYDLHYVKASNGFTITGGTVVANMHNWEMVQMSGEVGFYTDSSMSSKLYWFTLESSPNVGDEFYLMSDDVNIPTGTYRLRYKDIVLKATAGIDYLKEGAGTSATINRKTTRSNAPAIDEFIPINNALFDSTTQEQQVGQVVTDEYPDETTQTGTAPAEYDRTETSTVTESGHTITTVTYYKNVSVGGYQPGNPLAYDPVSRTLIPANNAPAIVLGDNYRFEVVEQPAGSLHTHLLMRRETTAPDTYKRNELATFNSDKTFDGTTPLVYDTEDNSLKPAEDITVSGDAHISGNVNIDGDLTVDGKITAVSEEIVQSKADYITLRQNNPNGLANDEHSGIIINNVDGEGKNTALVVDNDGMLRVGSAVGTETTYNEIYYKKADNKWYSDSTLETEVTVTGILTSWATSSETEDYIVYTDAVFTAIDASHNEPLMTRSEAEDLSDGAPLYWNEERKRAENAPATAGQQVWMSKMTVGHSAYDKNIIIASSDTSYGYLIENSNTHEKTAYDINGNEISVEEYTSVRFEARSAPSGPYSLYYNTVDNKLYCNSTDDPSKWYVQSGSALYDGSTDSVVVSFEETTQPATADIFMCTVTGIKYSAFFGYYNPTDMSKTTYPSDVPSDAVITNSEAYICDYSEVDDAFFTTGNSYKILSIDAEGNVTTDDTVTPTGTTEVASLIYRNIHADAVEDKMSYSWQQSSQGSFFVFDTFAEYQAALTIPPGQPGHIPTPEEGNAIVVVKEGKSYLYGEVNNE